MCAVGNQSPSQAVLNMMIMDTQVYKQKRQLPLIMQKKYQLELKRIKKMRAAMRRKAHSSEVATNTCAESHEESDHLTESECPVDVSEDDGNNVLLETENEFVNEVESALESYQDSDDPPPKKSKFDRSVDFVAQTKHQQKLDLSNVLPDPRSIRRAHHQAASYLEGEIGSLMVKDGKTFLMPDGTSRAKVGKMGATLVSIEGKMRALKLQGMGNEQRENWADTIIHQIQRLSAASNESVEDIYRSICSLVSDSCKVNKGLAAVISTRAAVFLDPQCVRLSGGHLWGIAKVPGGDGT